MSSLLPLAAAVLGTVPLGRLTFADEEWGLLVKMGGIPYLDTRISVLKPMAHHLGAVQLQFPEVGHRLSLTA